MERFAFNVVYRRCRNGGRAGGPGVYGAWPEGGTQHLKMGREGECFNNRGSSRCLH